MNQEMRKDLESLERMAVLRDKEEEKSIDEYNKLQKRIVTKYKTLLEAMAEAGLLTVCVWSSDEQEYIGWDVTSVVENGNFQLNTPVNNQTSKSVPKERVLKEINDIVQ